ncbi:hypothetical protein FQA39_LY10558 [Lamprigera yunnana]|nr:hypothetical protein FQA39_LY10558 [Lamprigera yunnana]
MTLYKNTYFCFITLICANTTSCVLAKHGNNLGDITDSITAVQGIVAKLPCDITATFSDDKIQIVIWYKEDDEGKLIPIYTFDSRSTTKLEKATQWSDNVLLEDRALFRFEEDPAILMINNVMHKDGGFYNCRVDFKRSPTRNSRLNLTVIIPPSSLIILNEKNVQVTNYELGPYNEGDIITLTCIAIGGLPSPKVTWWQENALLDGFSEDLLNNSVRNILRMEELQRKHFHTILTCQASNNDFVPPISTSMRLSLNLRPLEINILGENEALSAGKLYQIKCEVVDSYPAPKVTWWKGHINMVDVETKYYNGTAFSTLTFIPTAEDEGKYLSCNAEHPALSDSTIVSGRKLIVLYPPIPTLNLGKNLNNRIKEGSDVYFDCNIKANPWIYKICWKHNDKMLNSNIAKGVIINNQSLVLQNVQRDKTGSYLCTAQNDEGEGFSNSINLLIEYLPKCANKPVIYKALLNESIQIKCELDASPKEFEYMWTFNNSEGFQQYLSLHRNSTDLMYTLKSEKDYGTIMCKGLNAIGDQYEPCVFTIIPRDKMDLLSKCSLNNHLNQSLVVSCNHRIQITLNGTFVAEIYDSQTNELLKNLTSNRPMFIINDLIAGSQIELKIYISTTEGISNVIQLDTIIPKWKNVEASTLKFTITPTLGITISVVVILVIISIGLLAITRIHKCKRAKPNNCYAPETLLKPKFDDVENLEFNSSDKFLSNDDKNPDIITSNQNEPQKSYISLKENNDFDAEVTFHDSAYSCEQPKFKQEFPLNQYNYNSINRRPYFQSPSFFKYSHSRPAPLSDIPLQYQDRDNAVNVSRPLLTNHINRTPVTLLPQQLTATQL